jgi:DNA-binding MarR family transcriptional regulator
MAGSGREAPHDLEAGPALIRAATAVGDVYDEVAGALGLTAQQARLLFVLARRPTNMLGLGHVLGLGKSTMTGVVARMEAAGLVERSPDPGDRRHLVVAPTDRGAELAERFEAELRARVVALLDGLGPREQTTLGALLSRVVVRAEELRPPE